MDNPMDSILLSVKKMLGIVPEYTHFDGDLIIHINSVLSILTQLGVGPDEGYSISGVSDKWSSFVQPSHLLEMAKSYTYMKVRMLFDPPTGGAVSEAMKQQIAEYEWRITVAVDEMARL